MVVDSFNRGPIFHKKPQEEAVVGGLSKLNNKNKNNSNSNDDSKVSNRDNNNANANSNATNRASPLMMMQTQMTVTAINEFSNIMERKLATNIGTSKQTQDLVLSSLAENDSATKRRYLDSDSNLAVTADENDLDVSCLEREKKEVDNQVNDDDGNFVIREEKDEAGEEDERQRQRNNICMSSKADDHDDDEGFCLKKEAIEVVETTKSGLCVSRGEDIGSEIVDGQTEVLKKEGGTVIGSGKGSAVGRTSVRGQVTDKTSSSFSSALCSEPDRLIFDSSSKRRAFENVGQHLEDCSSIQANIEQQSGEKLDFESEIGTKEQQVVADCMMHSGCSLCNYLNSIRVLRHRELNSGEAKNSSISPSSSTSSLNDAASNNATNEQEQAGNEEPLRQKQQQQEENLNCHQASQQVNSQVSSSIKPRESPELSIWNNLKANLSADMYQYELEANLMIRRPTDEGSGVSGCCRYNSCVKGNDKNNESDVDGSCTQRHTKLHALNNNKAFESLCSNEERDKIDQVLNDDDNCCRKLLSKASASSNLGNSDTLANKYSNLGTTISDNKKITSTTTTTTTLTTTQANNKQTINYNKRPLKCSTRGLSLDSGDRNDSVNFSRRLNSRRFLTNQGKSQSTKLILIKSNNAAYTIQGKFYTDLLHGGFVIVVNIQTMIKIV